MINGSILRCLAAACLLAPATALASTSNAEKSAPKPEIADQRLGVATLSAVVGPNGIIARHVGVDTVQRLGIGTYAVTFERSVLDCTYVANVGSTAAGNPSFGVPVVASRSSNAQGVYVQIFNKNGAVVDNAFHLIVFCGY